MKIPTVRKPEPVPQSNPAEPPLDLEITHAVDEKLQTYALQQMSYGIESNGKAGLYSIIWIWIAAVLVFGAHASETIDAEGVSGFLSGLEPGAVLPGLFILTALSLGIYLWPRIAPRLRRKRNLAHLKRLGKLSPTRMTLRFDGNGIAVTEDSGEARFHPWQDQFLLTEDERWLCFHAPMKELNVVIPKRELSLDEQARVRRWNEVRQGGGATGESVLRPALAGAEIARSSDYTLTKDDYVIAMLNEADDPHVRRHRVTGNTLLALLIALALPAFHILAWAFDPDGLPVSLAWPVFLDLFATRFWIGGLIALTLLAVVFFFQPAISRFGARYYADRILATTPVTGLVVVGKNGVLDGDGFYLPWHAVSGYRIMDEYLIIVGGTGKTLIYPKRIFPPEKIAEIENLLREQRDRLGQHGDRA